MEETGTLSKLVSGLTSAEREELLSKLENQLPLLKEPLYQDVDDPDYEGNATRRFSKLSVFLRIWYYILGIFKSRPSFDVFKDGELSALGRKLEAEAPGIYNAARGYLLPHFYEAICKLRDNSRFFYSALDMGFNRDKGAFYGFLGSLEMENIHSRLVSETDPAVIAEKNPELSETVLRQIAQKNFEDILLNISEEQRRSMYANTRSLVCLRQLSSFLYDRLILTFNNDPHFGGMVCNVSNIRAALINLNNILFSLKECPSMSLLESFFIFIFQEQKDTLTFDVHTEIQRFLARAETSIAAIRDFNRNIPLARIARLAAGNVSLTATPVSGGEDWFLLYKDFWKRYIDDRFLAYCGKRRRQELRKTLAEFFQGSPLKSLENAASEENPDGIPVFRADSLCFLLTFHSGIFMPILNPFLRILLIDGEFRKKDSKLEYTESYNNLINLDDMIKNFDANLFYKGNWGKRYALARDEVSASGARRRKLQIIQEEIDEQARAIIDRSAFAINTIIRILNGITGKGIESDYSILFNLPRLNQKSPEFTEGLKKTDLKLRETAKMLEDIGNLETGGLS